MRVQRGVEGTRAPAPGNGRSNARRAPGGRGRVELSERWTVAFAARLDFLHACRAAPRRPDPEELVILSSRRTQHLRLRLADRPDGRFGVVGALHPSVVAPKVRTQVQQTPVKSQRREGTSAMPGSPPQSTDVPRALFDEVGDLFLRYYDTSGGHVRGEVIRHNLQKHLAAHESLCVLDIGCGEGRDVIWAARLGHSVVGVDSSARMLAAARLTRRGLPPEQRLRVTLLSGDQGSVHGSFDVIMCHGVLMYEKDAAGFLRQVAGLLAPGGVLSVVTTNAESLAYRAAWDGELAQARRFVEDPRAPRAGRLGVEAHAHSLRQLRAMIRSVGLSATAWYGIKIFSDSAPPMPPDELEQLVALEQAASATDPYRRTGRLLQLIARATAGRG